MVRRRTNRRLETQSEKERKLTLWFRNDYVDPILAATAPLSPPWYAATKTSTIRRQNGRLPRAGDVVAASVGPRPAFATLKIRSVETLRLIQIDDRLARDDGFPNAKTLRARLVETYPGETNFVLIRFDVVDASQLF